MRLRDREIVVTGGAGFVGSHLVERLISMDNDVTVIDNLSKGTRSWVPTEASFVNGDITDESILDGVLDSSVDLVFHLAAHKSVNNDDLQTQFQENTTMTHQVLAAARDAGVSNVAYTSTSTVYGEAPRPTPEDYGPLEPISVYGASKLADEGLLSTYAYSHGFTVWNFRFANVVGPRLRGAVIPDFIEKLVADSETLEILGDGRQEKSYLHISDCIDAMCHVISQANSNAPDCMMHTYNLGTRTTTSVDRIAEIVSDVLGVSPTFEYTGGERGWTGDVSRMCLSIEKLSALGWEPEMESDTAVWKATREIAGEMQDE